MAGHLEEKSAVATLVHQSAGRRPFHRETAEDERTRSIAYDLGPILSINADQLNGIRLTQSLLRDYEARVPAA
jgi:hypothetical protein